MVDWYGNWSYISGTEEEKKCDFDRLADLICESGYEIETDIENLVTMVWLYYDDPDTRKEYEQESTWLDGCMNFVRDSGGFKEFDYYA